METVHDAVNAPPANAEKSEWLAYLENVTPDELNALWRRAYASENHEMHTLIYEAARDRNIRMPICHRCCE